MTERHVVTCFLVRSDGRVLLLKRSASVGTYRGRWGAAAGYLESGVTPEAQARTEVREETGLTEDDAALVASGEPLVVEDAALGRRWVVHPFRLLVSNPERVRLDWESDAGEWVEPAEIATRETVPGLAAAWKRVAGIAERLDCEGR
jgi:8-oxo-dGTP diphosphatase